MSSSLRMLTSALILFLVLLSFFGLVVEARHSPDLQSKSRELLEAPTVLADWLGRVGREDLRVLLDEAVSTGNYTLMRIVASRVFEYLASDYPATLFVGGKHLMSLKILNRSEDPSVSSRDLGWLLYYTTRSLNKTDYSSLSSILLTILSGFVTYGDHNELSYFMIYLMREPAVGVISEDLRNELRFQILKFLDYVESGAFREAANFGVNVSYSTSILLGSCMYLIASSYVKYVFPDKLPESTSSESTIVSEILEHLMKSNISSSLIEILKRLPPEDLNRLLNNINILEGIDEEILIEEVSKYVRERRYNTSPTSSGSKTSSIVVKVFTVTDSKKDSEISYSLSYELSSLMHLISSTPTFFSGSGTSESTQDAGSSFSRGVALGSYTFLLLATSSFIISSLLLLRFFPTSRRDLVSEVSRVRPAPQARVPIPYVVVVFWNAVEGLCRLFKVSLGKHETHREIMAKLTPKIKVFAGEDAVKLFNDLTRYYELVRFGNAREDEVMKSVAKRVEERVRGWGQSS